MPGTASRPRLQSAKAPTPGSTMRSAAATIVRVGGHHDLGVGPALARRALEGLGRRVEVARAVIDDGDALHRGVTPRSRWPRQRRRRVLRRSRPRRPRRGLRRGAGDGRSAGARLRVGSQLSKKRRSLSSRLRPSTGRRRASRGARAPALRSAPASKPNTICSEQHERAADQSWRRAPERPRRQQRRCADEVDGELEPQAADRAATAAGTARPARRSRP